MAASPTICWAAWAARCSEGTDPSALKAIVLVAGLLLAAPVAAQRSGVGSTVPCAVPMRWTVERIDGRFDLSADDALRAARDAARLWEGAVDADLFDISPTGGSPIYFEYDERQATVEARREREAILDGERKDVERRRGALEAASAEHDAALRRYQRQVEEHRSVVRAYNADAQRWSGREIPAEVEAEFERRRREIDETARELQAGQRALNQRSEEIRGEVDDFNGRVESLAQEERTFARDFPMTASESGTYDEMVTWENGRPVSVNRRIRIYQYSSHDELVLVLAHEMGHALGLGHARGEGAVMSEVFTTGVDIASVGSVTSVDIRLLGQRCPELVR